MRKVRFLLDPCPSVYSFIGQLARLQKNGIATRKARGRSALFESGCYTSCWL